MTKKIFKIILNLIIFITASFLFDLALHYFSNLKINRILNIFLVIKPPKIFYIILKKIERKTNKNAYIIFKTD
jgi:hypothetical protein